MGSRSSALLPRLKPPPDPSGRHQNSAIAREHPEQAVRACLGVLRLAGTYGKERLELACERAPRRRRRLLALCRAAAQGRPAAPFSRCPRRGRLGRARQSAGSGLLQLSWPRRLTPSQTISALSSPTFQPNGAVPPRKRPRFFRSEDRSRIRSRSASAKATAIVITANAPKPKWARNQNCPQPVDDAQFWA
jgi:hypothetical protein